MDPHIQRSLNDKLYDKRKIGALDLEKVIRDCIDQDDHERIRAIIHELCHEYAYSVHQPNARNGGLIGLAAASIALGPEVAQYLGEIVPPVLACFSDQDARVRYYACESMYNIAKVAKGEILPFFNSVFDALCKLAADAELSVKNGAELFDRLIKDIVAESAATYVSVLQSPEESIAETSSGACSPTFQSETAFPTAFSLPRFIPLLRERIHVINPFTRNFLVSWITLLDSIPDLELVTYLPDFLEGLFKFLNDPNKDVQVATQDALEGFLQEIRRIARLKRGIEDSRKSRTEKRTRTMSDSGSGNTEEASRQQESMGGEEYAIADDTADGSWIPGQDVQIDHQRIIEILIPFLEAPNDISQEDIQLTALRWVDDFFEICPEDLVLFLPRLLSMVLPAISSNSEAIRQAALKVNTSLMNLVASLSDDMSLPPRTATPSTPRLSIGRAPQGGRDSIEPPREAVGNQSDIGGSISSRFPPSNSPIPPKFPELDYQATVNALTLQFLNEFEETRVVALEWLIMLHKKAPRKILAINDGTFPALLKTLSDSSDQVVQRDLQLLSQISQNSEDDYFALFMVNLLSLFSTDRRLLETRGNMIIRQLCTNLNPEKIYRTLADILEKDEDVEFASIMVQNLNNILITAPELIDLRKRLRSLDTKDGQMIFVSLFRSWCYNAVATFSLCLLAQAYEQASNLLQIMADLDITVNMLIQVDKLVQLLESPVFTYLRLQLLEPEKYPFLYKSLYGLLMLLPQSSAFGLLKNRLNSVSPIGYLHIVPRGGNTQATNAPTQSYERPTRVKGRAEDIKWMELLDKFRAVQERARRQTLQQYSNKPSAPGINSNGVGTTSATFTPPRVPTPSGGTGGNAPSGSSKPRGGLTGIGRLAGGRKAASRGK
ncbi:ARM repeat-containing protein [Terfezia boudieri ATCC MYA-4762]|uniref:ARM repeat-containing protein n=1 Tax=Terfezia boudieri ATCC MYA-4762 TaxID=1051890 RepID=A0A3N4LS43_9PEZI|nr:ARM repeat-containing protein [Terfezia boudieri ATCC MYA-4762]